MSAPLQTRVMAKPSSFTVAPSSTPTGLLQRKCACGGAAGLDDECAECRTMRLQRKPVGQVEPTGVPPIVHEVLRSPGQPLDSATRAFMEPRFGHDFSQVRVHTDAKAAESARAVNAQAFTVGQNIVFSTGQYEHRSNRGKSLLAHELAHVVQQSDLTPTSHLVVEASNSSLEQEAVWAATRAASGQQISCLGQAMTPSIQRNERTEAAETRPNVSLGFLDSRITDSIASNVMGSVQWRLLRETLRGTVEGVQSTTDERKNRIIARFLALSLSLSDQWSYFRGYLVGIGLGLWDSLRGIFDLLTLGPRLLWRALDWLVTQGPGIVRNFDQIQAEAQELRNRLAEVGEQVGTTLLNFMRNPSESLQALRAMLNRFSAAAQERARQVGRGIAERIFQFLELPWREFGESIGRIVGMVLFEVLLAVATQGIGTALRAIGSTLARGGRLLAIQALRLFRWVGDAVKGLSGLLRSLGRTALSVFEGLGRLLGRLLERIEALVRRVIGGMEAAEAALPERALAGGGRMPPGAMMSEARGASRVPTRTTMTTVEELRPPRTPRSEPFAGDPEFQKSIKELEDVPSVNKDEPLKDPLSKDPLSTRTRKQAGVSLEEDHHIATRYRKANRTIFEKVGFHVDDDLNLIKEFPEHGQLRGWYDWKNRSYKFNMKGHHPEYNSWVTKTLTNAIPPGLAPDQALNRILQVTQRLGTIIKKHPEVLSHGPDILPLHLRNLTF